MKQTKGQLTRLRIIETALKLYERRGIQDVSFQEIADKIGISQAGMYKYFSDRAELLQAVILYSAEKGREFLFGEENISANARIRILDHIKKNLLWVTEDGVYNLGFSLLHYYATHLDAIHVIYEDINKTRLLRLRSYLEQGQREGLWDLRDTTKVAISINNLLVGEMFQAMNKSDDETITDRMGRIRSLLRRILV